MSNEHEKPKPGDADPEATVFLRRENLAAPPVDEDATVSIQRSNLSEPPAKDEDATVMMPAMKREPEIDLDATVMMKPPRPEPAADEDATVAMSPAMAAQLAAAAKAGADQPGFDPDATYVRTPPAPPAPPAPPPYVPAPASNVPWSAIAGGVVVLLVILYFVFGGKESAPPVPVAATPPVPAAPAPTPTPTAPAAETAQVAATPAAPAPALPAASTAPAASASVESLLAGEIKRGLVAVKEGGGATTISLGDAHQFDGGDVDPEARLRPVLQAIATALDKVPGTIVVTGHADTTASTDKRFPSNKELSAARAEAAAKVMAEKLRDPGRLKSEGASDTQPLVPNDSVANRAKNRRVVIVLKPAA